MARPIAYDRELVVEAATQLFWKKGYHGTALSELVAVTGLNKHSLYKEFGNKAGLFDACLTNYRASVDKDLLSILNQKPLGLTNIRNYFKNRFEYMNSEGFKSCLMLKTSLERELVEDSALEQVRITNHKFEEAYIGCLKAAIECGELPRTINVRLAAEYMSFFASGMMATGKRDGGKDDIDALISLILTAVSVSLK